MRDRTSLALSGAAFAAFLCILAAVKGSASVRAADLQAALWVNHLPLGSLSGLMDYASLYGREYFWIPVVAVMLLFGDRRTKLVALGLSGVFEVGIGVGELAKELVARARPEQVLGYYVGAGPMVRIPFETDYSFPSGHARIVSIGAVYSVAAFSKMWVAVLLAVEAAVVCFARVYTFEHFPTDVVGGAALGAALALAGLVVERRYLRGWGDRAAGAVAKLLRDGPLKL